MEPHAHDVLSGRGNGSNMHPGNMYFRSLIANERIEYATSNPRQKKEISKRVVEAIYKRVPPGRFLTKDKRDRWEVMSAKKILKKTSQALREGQRPIKESFDPPPEESAAQQEQIQDGNDKKKGKVKGKKNSELTIPESIMVNQAQRRPMAKSLPVAMTSDSEKPRGLDYRQSMNNAIPPHSLNMDELNNEFNSSLDLSDVFKIDSTRNMTDQSEHYNASTEMQMLNSGMSLVSDCNMNMNSNRDVNMNISNRSINMLSWRNLGVGEIVSQTNASTENASAEQKDGDDFSSNVNIDFHPSSGAAANTRYPPQPEQSQRNSRPALSFYSTTKTATHTFQSLSGRTLTLDTNSDGRRTSVFSYQDQTAFLDDLGEDKTEDEKDITDNESATFDESILNVDFSRAQIENDLDRRSGPLFNTFKSLSGRTLSLRSLGSE